jgi:hypothetical protein
MYRNKHLDQTKFCCDAFYIRKNICQVRLWKTLGKFQHVWQNENILRIWFLVYFIRLRAAVFGVSSPLCNKCSKREDKTPTTAAHRLMKCTKSQSFTLQEDAAVEYYKQECSALLFGIQNDKFPSVNAHNTQVQRNLTLSPYFV